MVGAAACGVLLSGALGATPAFAGGTQVSVTGWLTGLNAPRGLAFDGHGNLYVAESGLAGSGPMGLSRTGKVSKYRAGTTDRAWSTGFSSVYVTEDPTQPPDVLGPEGLSALGDSCRSDHSRGPGCTVTMIMSESRYGVLTQSGGAIDDPQAGHLFHLAEGTGVATDVADVGDQQIAFTAAHPNPDEPLPDSNPFGVLVVRDHGKVRTFVADAGANTLVEVEPNGRTRVVALFPNDTIRDATPTCVTQGPDGALYVGTLNLVANFALGGGVSNVWRVDPDANYPAAPQLWATGLTTVTGCTFDRSGNFWATEMFGPTGTPPLGDLVRIRFHQPTQLQRFGAGKLPLPGGIAQGPDGALYVSVNSAAPGPAGAVVKVNVQS